MATLGTLTCLTGCLPDEKELPPGGCISPVVANLSQTQPLRHLANLEPDPVIEEPAVDNHHSEPPSRRELIPRQLALWKAVQQARAQSLSVREISRQLGVHRNTVRKYARSLTQPTNRPINRGASGSFQPAINRSD